MRYFALATDYDGTLAHDGVVSPATITALEQLRARYAGAAWEALVSRIAARELDPYTAAADLLGSEGSKQ